MSPLIVSYHDETVTTQLYHQYPGESTPQSAYIELNCQTGNLIADWDAETGSAVPARVYHATALRWPIPPTYTPKGVNLLIDKIAPIARCVLAGFSVEWDGNNNVGAYTESAESAITAIESLCAAAMNDTDENHHICPWTPGDWLADASWDDIFPATDTPETAAQAIVDNAASECALIIGGQDAVVAYLRDRAVYDLDMDRRVPDHVRQAFNLDN